MSFSDLLKDEDSSPAWSRQRKRLFQIVAGSLIVLFSLGVVAFILFAGSESEESADSSDVQEQRSVEALTGLMRLQKEAERLKREVHELNHEATRQNEIASDRLLVARSETKRRPPQHVAADSHPQIVNFDPGDGFTDLVDSQRSFYIPTGAVFQARLITPIKTSVARTFVMAETTNEFRMDMERRIPKGSRLIGRARLNPVLKGVIVEFDTLVLPDGIETRLEGLALSRNALPEIDGLYFSDSLETYGTALAFGFLSGFADAARHREATVFGSQPTVSVSNQVLAGLSSASFQVAEEILRDIRSSAVEYVVVPAGEPIFVALTRRYELNQGVR